MRAGALSGLFLDANNPALVVVDFATPCPRATSLTTAPGISVSSTIRDFPRTFPSIST